MYTALHVFYDVLFHWKIAIKDEAEVADGSRKFNIGIAERKIVRGCGKVVLIEDDDEIRIVFGLIIIQFVFLAQYLWHNTEVSHFQAIQSDWVVYRLRTFRD